MVFTSSHKIAAELLFSRCKWSLVFKCIMGVRSPVCNNICLQEAIYTLNSSYLKGISVNIIITLVLVLFSCAVYKP